MSTKKKPEPKVSDHTVQKLIDEGYRALLKRLGSDRGGSKEARLNRVRDELKSFAQTRRFI